MIRIKNRPRTLGQFIIDLTPLLDVIFILLIVVLCFQDNYSKEADEKVAAAEQQEQIAVEKAEQTEKTASEKIAEIRQETEDAMAANDSHYEAVQQQLEVYEQMYDYVNVVTVVASYKPSNRKDRTLHVEINAEDQWEREINPSNEDKVWAECQAHIESVLAGKTGMPTVFAIKNEKMLYRDEQSILELYDKLNIEDKFEKNYTETDDE